MTDREIPNLGRQRRPDLYITHCKICRHGIYQGQRYAWYRRPLGRSHVECATRAGAVA